MVKNSDECWHVAIRLPNGLIFDGGLGVHDELMYKDKFDIIDMLDYDLQLLEKHSGGLNRKYPRYCPDFSIDDVTNLIENCLNLIKSNITFQKLIPSNPQLASVISMSIGNPTHEKIARVLHGYELPNQYLIGAFSSETLIAIIGFELVDKQAIIKHISVLDDFKKQGIGTALIYRLIKDYVPSRVTLETDDESVGFYKKTGFICKPVEGKYGIRYRCSLSSSM